MAEEKIAEEVAESEFQRFLLAMDLDSDVEKMSEEVAGGFVALRRVVIRAMQRRSLVIDDNGQAVFTPQYDKDATPVTFYVSDGSVLSSMDKKKENEQVLKKFTAMGVMTKTNAVRFSTMDVRDLKICQALYLLFLA